jgi:hypothetical protein
LGVEERIKIRFGCPISRAFFAREVGIFDRAKSKGGVLGLKQAPYEHGMQSRIAYSADDAALLQSRPSSMTNKIGPQIACRRRKKRKAGSPQPQDKASEKPHFSQSTREMGHPATAFKHKIQPLENCYWKNPDACSSRRSVIPLK